MINNLFAREKRGGQRRRGEKGKGSGGKKRGEEQPRLALHTGENFQGWASPWLEEKTGETWDSRPLCCGY